MKFKLLIFLSFLIVSFKLIAQTDFRPGYIITNKYDTISGFIDFRGEIRNSRFCVFKKDEASDSEKYHPGEIHSYKFNDSKYYISKIVDSDTLFLEYIVNGIVDLYFFKSPTSHSYFIEKDGRLLLLENDEEEKYIEDVGNRIVKSNKHIGLLKYAFSDCMEIQSEVENVQLTHKSLINLSVDYHNMVCDGEECIVYQKKTPKVKVQFIPYFSVDLAFLKYTNIDFTPSIRPSIGAIFNFSLPRINEKMFLNLESSFSRYHFVHNSTNQQFLSIEYYEEHVRTNVLTTCVSYQYKFPKGNIRPIIELGVGTQFYFNGRENSTRTIETSSTVKTTTTDDKQANVFAPIAKIGAGANFKLKNIDCYTTYNFHFSFLFIHRICLGIYI